MSDIGKQTAGKASVTHYVKLTPSKDEPRPSLICDFHKEEPKGIAVGQSVTVEGTGRLGRVQADDGSTSNRLELRDCAVVP